MTLAYDLTLSAYNLTLIPMTFFSILFIILSLLYLLTRERAGKARTPKLTSYPFVTVLVPSYNDPIAARCVTKCLAFDYPADRYEIIIVDDSTNSETRELLHSFERTHPGKVHYVHREKRVGFKPGALKNAMKHVRGEVMVVFDADWIPKRDFLRRVIPHFGDPQVAIVQTRQGFYNYRRNLISRFAAYTLMIYHTIVMPLNARANTVFFCGTAGAIRTSAFKKVGGWNVESITEDSELTVRLLAAGFTTRYVDYETPSEVPETFEGFVKQQMRWCYGNVRVFIDHRRTILGRSRLTFKQRLMISYVTMGNLVAPIVVLMTLFGFAGWFLGDPAPLKWADVITLVSRFLLTVGFLTMGLITLSRMRKMREAKYLLASAFTIGIVLSVANTIALTKAVANRKLGWFCTPKEHNTKLVSE